ncbi:MAG TPA: RraA family protein [Gammaproteobacteria bacterium]|nr:RraA family protein [Gammaproteobacteria bacterium]
MALTVNRPDFSLLSSEELELWSHIPTSIISDELNRTGTLHSEVRPLQTDVGLAGQALTVQCMVGDNAPIHYAMTVAWPGCVMLVDGRGHKDTALFGEILGEAALARGVIAVIIDGAVRDSAELRSSDLYVYTRGIVPNGPHKGFGGAINVPIQCAGVNVSPGDLVVGDDDGVVVITPQSMKGLRSRCDARIASEADRIERIKAGATTVELLGFPPPEKIGS